MEAAETAGDAGEELAVAEPEELHLGRPSVIGEPVGDLGVVNAVAGVHLDVIRPTNTTATWLL
jgi:hypothetical protein